MAYRDGPGRREVAPADDTGIVGDLIAQFADPYAFLRELVQNSIDAGTSSVSVTVVWEEGGASPGPTPGTISISARDDGEGMDRTVIEEQLLVLFRSGKEGQEGKIGKFGVGFVSVFAMQPELVVVQTSRGDGAAHVLHLAPDQTYELFEVPGGSASGTTVTLRVPAPRERVVEIADACVKALETWCRHASVPIHLVARLANEDAPLREVRIDRPLGLEGALVAVERASPDQRTRLVVGLNARARAYSGFFNNGLLLHETDEAMAGHVAFKVQDARLEHTLSRDNVRRDGAFDAALALVRETVRTALVPALEKELAAAAMAKELARHRALFGAAVLSGLPIDATRLVLPLLHPVGGADVIHGHAFRARGYVARTTSPLVGAAARAGIAAVDASGLDDESFEELRSHLRHVVKRPVEALHDALTLVEPVETHASDEAMLRATTVYLERVDRAPGALSLGTFSGAADTSLFLPVADENRALILGAEERARNPFALFARPALSLSSSHPLVVAARGVSNAEPELAGAFLARAILLAAGRLDDGRDALLTAEALEALRGERP